MASVVILAFILSGVFMIVSRNVSAAAESVMKMKAFEVARENMEMLIGSREVEEKIEFGISEIYPDIQWQTTVETFYDPIYSKMWVRAVCEAEYIDSKGETQTVELTHWLTRLSAQQERMLRNIQENEDIWYSDLVLETIEEAAQYAGVDIETINIWLGNRMMKTIEGFFIKGQLDLYLRTDGNPTFTERVEQAKIDKELLQKAKPGVNPDQMDQQDNDYTGDSMQLPEDLDPTLKEALKGLRP
jgi:hypothetical protein